MPAPTALKCTTRLTPVAAQARAEPGGAQLVWPGHVFDQPARGDGDLRPAVSVAPVHHRRSVVLVQVHPVHQRVPVQDAQRPVTEAQPTQRIQQRRTQAERIRRAHYGKTQRLQPRRVPVRHLEAFGQRQVQIVLKGL